VIATTTARALRTAGLAWEPARGDAFVIPDRGMDADVFVLSDMTIQAHDFPTGRVLGFNGTTEWALDSVDAAQALWLPGEGRLRELLGPAFGGLARRADGAWAVTVVAPGRPPQEVLAPDAEEAYGLALLSVLARTARDLLPVAAAALTRRVRDVGGLWAAPVPAGGRGGPERTVGDVVAQVAAQHREAAAALGAAVPAPHPDGDPGDLASEWDAARDASLGAWAALEELDRPLALPEGVVPARALAERLLLDLLLATWDAARGARLDDALDPACVRLALVHLRGHHPGTTTAGEDEQQELLVLTGRRPG